MYRHTLLWFTNNLRLDDNTVFNKARNSEQLTCLFIQHPRDKRTNRFGFKGIGKHRQQFLNQALSSLHSKLSLLNQALEVIESDYVEALSQVILRDQVEHLVTSRHTGSYEQSALKEIASRFPHLVITVLETHTLYGERQLPFALAELPDSFTPFRKKIESIEVDARIAEPDSLPPLGDKQGSTFNIDCSSENAFNGSEQSALDHLEHYFSSDLPATYKETRNGLDEWACSTKFSPWLALGVLSPKRIIERLNRYEEDVVANDSTYWIFFELLWRDYFQWYAHKWGNKIYHQTGPFNRKPLTSFYPERMKSWIEGTTPYPIVNAAMRQLKATGYQSNRARQLVASCLVHELGIDWRYGAAYFEEALIDFDLASNWGNWQYLGGVGADPRGHRQFNLAKQTQTYDPEGLFIQRWGGEEMMLPIDRVDYHDWPIEMK
ncbi:MULTISPECIES: DASH family cryptochrome [unclassified Marinobacterium]|uniref:DASH family cryptochrome n=1 Tax=unclassified Marinobacterium TaxID=2644139 RepID=UPI001569B138|nr:MULTISPECIES: DASH family cryptochrome [unclassified Marinobacterium]NRP47151.1 Cryptochrome DASH [Marinobacterium sp. xm-d-543]NRQ22884.1 Cryptochrome DASH [Marinobacterium sp. xm-m-312]